MATPQVKVLKWGIFDLAYEVPERSISLSGPIRSVLSILRWPRLYGHVWRLVKDLFRIAPMTFSAYIVSSVWLGISPALSLQLSHSIIHKMEDLTNNRNSGHLQLILQAELTCEIFALLFSALLSVIIDKLRHEKELLLCGHLRYHYLPLIVTASVNTDMEFTRNNDVRRYFPTAGSYGEGGPCWSLLKALTERLQNVISLVLELVVLINILLQRDTYDRFFLGTTACMFFLVLIYTPTNGINGAGYTFWTTNTAYHQLNSLYSIAFGEMFREQLVKDGINGYISEEYMKYSQQLGVVKSDVLGLACLLPISWYNTALQRLFLEYPTILCALFLKWNSSPYTITTLVIFQSALSSIRSGINNLRWSCDLRALSGLLSEAKALYHSIDRKGIRQCSKSTCYPTTSASGSGGMAVQLRGVTYKYQDTGGHTALRDVSLKIPANSLVLLVGENGSGKSTLLKLLAGLQEPKTGDIFIDDTPITFYDRSSIRKHINFLMQSEDIYPLSLKENLLMVVPDRKNLGEKTQEKMDEAIRLGGSEKLVERVGYDAVLNPPILLAQSLQGCGNGPVGSAALRELEKHTQRRLITVSHGEKQRFIASRSFMRLLNSDTRLLMVDEPTSALDPIVERDIFQRFRDKSIGKTAIFVTHRFANLAQHADMIVCMKNGEIVEQGRHDDLMSVGGEYARLYNAQQV